MTVLILESKNDLHRLSFLTALDIYLIVCFLFILSSIMEFAYVHYEFKYIYEQDIFTIYRLISLNKRLLKRCHKNNNSNQEINGESAKLLKINDLKDKRIKSENLATSLENNIDLSYGILIRNISDLEKNFHSSFNLVNSLKDQVEVLDYGRDEEQKLEIEFDLRLKDASGFCYFYKYLRERFNIRMCFFKFSNEKKEKSKNYDRVSKIDRYARFLYPLIFTLFNLIYWKYYLSKRDFFD
jgi:hypothetical protein